MRRAKHIQIDGIFAILYDLSDGMEIHFTVNSESTYVAAARTLLAYLDHEGFVGAKPLKLITIPRSKANGKTS